MLEGTNYIVDRQAGIDWLHARFVTGCTDRQPASNNDAPMDIDQIRLALDCIPADDYGTWISVGMALKSGGCPVELWDKWSAKSKDKYDAGAITAKWNSFKGKKITLGTLFHLAMENGFKFSQAGAGVTAAPGHLDIARQTLSSYGSGNLILCQGRFHKWDGRIWISCDEGEISSRIIDTYESMKIANKVTGQSIRSVLTILRSLSEVIKPDALFSSQANTICCANGELFFDGRDWDLRPHCRENYRQSMLPVSYNPDAVAPRFERYLDEVFAGDPDQANKIKCTKQFLGYSLTTHCRFERCLILNGVGRNGKSKLIFVIEKLVGEHNRAAVDPGQFDNKFQRASLRGKLINIVTELSEGHKINDGSFKAFVSGEPITAEEKQKPPFEFRPYAKLWFATNHLPHTRDTSRAFFTRAIVLEFNNIFEGEGCDPNLEEKLKPELSGILNLALAGLASLYTDGKFTEPESSNSAKEAWHHDVDQVAQFIEERCAVSPIYKSTVAEIYDEYVEWTMRAGISLRCSKISLSRRLKQFGISSKSGTGNQKWFQGIQLNRNSVTYAELRK